MSLLGFFTNWFVFRTLLKLKSFRMAFGYLSASQSLADAFHSTTFLFYFFPLVLTTHPFLVKHAHLLGLSIMTCYELSLYTHLAISINRFCAVWIPQSYSKVFSIRNTLVIIVVIWIVLVTSNLTYYEYLCEIVYYEQMHSIGFGQTETCTYVGLFAVLLKNLFFIFILIIVDVFTLIGVKKTRVTTHMSSTTQDRISNREKRFIKQIIYQGIIIVIELTVYFIIPQLSKDPDVFFFSTTFTYVTVHAIDGVCMVIIYPDIRASLFCHKKVVQSSSINKTGP
ncbi:hypothetical protein CAEBREN_21897 [Caenorhabditis brenneri]|uniref:G-protein coupled receptors family 1 profile domain-containing protein n=1 Tax=Caenorhabditis brenneri TaxID=135651 RepID=G0PM90_CAEBE|nr:hypothetical protein CAEBREN_21897 [Caenorhabditis brenneri]